MHIATSITRSSSLFSPLKVSLRDMLTCLTVALDGINPSLISHHRTTAYAATRIAIRMGLSAESVRNVFLAALFHDIGTAAPFRCETSGKSGEADPAHPIVGAKYLSLLPALGKPADLVRFHHIDWERRGQLEHWGISVPKESGIIYLADWIAHAGIGSGNILSNVARLLSEAKDQRGRKFDPDVVDAFVSLGVTEGFWLDLFSTRLERILARYEMPDATIANDDLQRMAWLFSVLIDSHSRFTATHSSGVAATAMALAEARGWTGAAVDGIAVAGFLHDIGKLTVPTSILDKRGKLTAEEWSIVKAHTFHTQRILEVVEGLETVTKWAADHHETLDGAGYPFHKPADEIPEGSRIMSIVDIFTAVTEDRPYRAGLSRAEVTKLLQNNVAKGALDGEIAECLFDNYTDIDDRRAAAQRQRESGLRAFWDDCQMEISTFATPALMPGMPLMVPTADY